MLKAVFLILISLLIASDGDFDPSRNPEQDLKAAIELAQSSNRRIILDVGGKWCIWCKRLDAFFEQDTEVKYLRDKHFVWVKVNFSPENQNRDFLCKFPKIDGYPHLFVLDKNGVLLHSQNTSELESGKGYSKTKFLEFFRKWIKE